MGTIKSILLFTMVVINVFGETILRNVVSDPTPIICIDYPCNIHCMASYSCQTNISCPMKYQQAGICSISLIGAASAKGSVINTGNSLHTSITISGAEGLQLGTIYGNEIIGATLSINVYGNVGLQSSIIYSSYGKNSELNIVCGDNDSQNNGCSDMVIYDDYSTTVLFKSFSAYGFQGTVVSPQTNLPPKSNDPNDVNYFNYRGSVSLMSYIDNGMRGLTYYGMDHGNWTIWSNNQYGHHASIFYAHHSFIGDNNESYLINVTATGSDTNAVSSITLYASQNNGHIQFNAYTNSAFTFSSSGTNIICNNSNMTLQKLELNSFASTAFQYVGINISSDIGSISLKAHGASASSSYRYMKLYHSGTVFNDAAFEIEIPTGASNNAMRDAVIYINKVNGNAYFIDNSFAGLGFYGTQFSIPNGIGGDLLLVDNTTYNAQGHGQTFASTTVTVGDVEGNVEFSAFAVYGYSFRYLKCTIGTVKGHIRIESKPMTGVYAMGNAVVVFERIVGSLFILCNSAHSFRESILEVKNGIGGNITLLDEQYLSFYNSILNFSRNIEGNVLLRALGTSTDCRSFNQATIEFDNILGDLTAIDACYYGRAFRNVEWNINQIVGTVHFESVGTRQSSTVMYGFSNSIVKIDSIGDNLFVIDNVGHGFRDSNWQIGVVHGKIYFISNKTAATGTFRSTTLSINASQSVTIETSSNNAFYQSIFRLGNVQTVQLNVVLGINSLYQSVWDCQNCNQFELNCGATADCGHVTQILCPKDNQQNKCIINCDESALCDDIDIFTNNGFCNDVLLLGCINTNSAHCSNSRIFCTVDSATEYGIVGTDYCTMQRDSSDDNNWICSNFGTSKCVANNTICTPSPTNSPTFIPTSSPTQYPSVTPTKYPTNNPSNTPTQMPSNIPTTSTPTTTTFNPTVAPTVSPTSDGNAVEVGISTTIETAEATSGDQQLIQAGNNNALVYGFIIAIVILTLTLVVFVCLWYRLKKQSRGNVDNSESKIGIELQHISSVSHVQQYNPTQTWNNTQNNGSIRHNTQSQLSYMNSQNIVAQDVAKSLPDNVVLGADEVDLIDGDGEGTPLDDVEEKDDDYLVTQNITVQNDENDEDVVTDLNNMTLR